MNYILKLKGKEGEVKEFPLDSVEMIKITMDKDKSKKGADYWVYELSDGENVITTREDVTFQTLTKYSKFIDQQIELDLTTYQGEGLEDFILKETNEGSNFDLGGEGFKVILRDDFNVKGVIPLEYGEREFEKKIGLRFAQDRDLHKEDVSRHRTYWGNFSIDEGNIELSEGTNIDVGGESYQAELVYGLGNKNVSMAKGRVRFADILGDSDEGNPETEKVMVIYGNTTILRLMLGKVAEAIEGLEDDLKEMLLDEVKIKYQ